MAAENTQCNNYKRMAGTSAVFVKQSHSGSLPVERDGLTWSAAELAIDTATTLRNQPDMASVLALEGLEDYDPPTNGDYREVRNLKCGFRYIATKKAWVEA